MGYGYIKLPITFERFRCNNIASALFSTYISSESSIIVMNSDYSPFWNSWKSQHIHQGERNEMNVFMFYIRFQLSLPSLFFHNILVSIFLNLIFEFRTNCLISYCSVGRRHKYLKENVIISWLYQRLVRTHWSETTFCNTFSIPSNTHNIMAHLRL